jgi:lysophospholipase L1-like esterase
MNEGVSADSVYHVLNRLEPVVGLQPAYVVVLVGTNDVQASLRGGYLAPVMQRDKRLPQAMTVAWFDSLLRQMVQRLREETAAKLGLCSIPILGEALDSVPNERVREFNRSIRVLADEVGVGYLPVYERMEGFLNEHQQRPGRGYNEVEAGEIMRKAAWQYYVRGRSWDDISAGNGLLLTTDTVHFNGRGAGIIADLIEGWLRQAAV